MCRILCVSRSGFYEWFKRPASQRTQQDQALKTDIKASHENSRETYGTRRIQSDLANLGKKVSRKRIRRLMKEEDLETKMKRAFKVTTDSRHNKPVAENLLNREFTPECPDRVFVGDITYIQTLEGWLYLSVFIDLYSRTVVGWSMDKRMTATLVTDSLEMALRKRQPKAGLIVHSDRGSQYVSDSYQKLLKKNKYVCSMSRKGNCWDNAPSESFFHTLKTEMVHHEKFKTRSEAKQAIFEYIEVFYNRQRKHSTIGYIAPMEYDEAYTKAA
jgi:transposase InsO family protein